MKLSFSVPGLPRAKQRPRHGRYGNVYTPRTTQAYEYEVWVMAQSAGARQLMFGDRPLWVGLKCYFTRPVRRCNRIPLAPFPTRDPDIDNVLKVILDGMKAAYHDDSQVVGLLAGSGKYWAEKQSVYVFITDNREEGSTWQI